MQFNILEAKTSLSSLVIKVETGEEDSVIIAKHGNSAAKQIIYNNAPTDKRIGIAHGKLKSPDDLDKYNNEIADMFGGVL